MSDSNLFHLCLSLCFCLSLVVSVSLNLSLSDSNFFHLESFPWPNLVLFVSASYMFLSVTLKVHPLYLFALVSVLLQLFVCLHPPLSTCICFCLQYSHDPSVSVSFHPSQFAGKVSSVSGCSFLCLLASVCLSLCRNLSLSICICNCHLSFSMCLDLYLLVIACLLSCLIPSACFCLHIQSCLSSSSYLRCDKLANLFLAFLSLSVAVWFKKREMFI